MNDSRDDRDALVARLAAEAGPGRRRFRPARYAFLWVAVAAVTSGALLAVGGPIRPGAVAALAGVPRYLAETLTGLVAVAGFAVVAFRAAVPGLARAEGAHRRLLGVALAATACWVGLLVAGLTDPALPASMAGKRPHCFVDTVLVALPLLGLGMAGVARGYPLSGARAGAWLALASAILAALAMQFHCMYVPAHILTHHMAPGLAVIPLGMLLGRWWLRR